MRVIDDVSNDFMKYDDNVRVIDDIGNDFMECDDKKADIPALQWERVYPRIFQICRLLIISNSVQYCPITVCLICQ